MKIVQFSEVDPEEKIILAVQLSPIIVMAAEDVLESKLFQKPHSHSQNLRKKREPFLDSEIISTMEPSSEVEEDGEEEDTFILHQPLLRKRAPLPKILSKESKKFVGIL